MLVYELHVCGTAACGHVAFAVCLLVLYFLSLVNCSDLSTLGNLNDIGKTCLDDRALDLGKGTGILTLDCGSNHGNDLLLPLDHLENGQKAALLGNCTERTASGTASAADAVLVVDLDHALLVLPDGTYRTCLLTGNGDVDYGVEGTYVHTLTASDTSFLVDVGLTVDEADRILGTVGHTGACEAAAACVTDPVLIGGTSVTSGADRGEQGKHGRILPENLGGICLKRLELIIKSLDVDSEQCHDSVTDHCPFLVDTATVRYSVFGDNGIRKFIDLFLKLSGKEQSEYLSIDASLHRRILVVEFKHCP